MFVIYIVCVYYKLILIYFLKQNILVFNLKLNILQEFDEKAKNCLEHVKLKEENGLYLNSNYLKNCLPIKNLSKKTQELNRVNHTRNIPINLVSETIILFSY